MQSIYLHEDGSDSAVDGLNKIKLLHAGNIRVCLLLLKPFITTIKRFWVHVANLKMGKMLFCTNLFLRGGHLLLQPSTITEVLWTYWHYYEAHIRAGGSKI